MSTDFWERPLDSFADDIIVSARQADWGGWYAVLDWGGSDGPGDPDFSCAAGTKEDAISRCATSIRRDQMGFGKYAPHDLDMWRLRKYWAEKERMRAAP